MKILPAVLYFLGYFAAGKLIQGEYAVFIIVILTAGFVWAHVVWVRNKIWSALTIVLIFSLVFPLVGLYFIGSVVYESWQETVRRLYEIFREHGQFGGLEFLFPILAAVVTIYLVKSYNKSLKERDREKRAAP